MKKLIRSIIVVLAFTMLFSMTVFAGTGGNGDSSEEGKVDPNASVSGFSKLRSGYLIYITDAAGSPVSDVVLVPFASAPASNVHRQGLVTRVTSTSYTGIYSGTISTATNGGFNTPPLDVTTGGTYGASMKSWLLADDDGNGMANAYSLIENLFGDNMKSAFKDNDYYLCIEAVAWMGLQSSENPVMVAGTSMTLNKIYNQLGSTYMNFLRQARLPHSGYLQYAWAGCSVPTIHAGQRESIADVTAVGNGYGIIMCRSTEIGTPPDTPPEPANVDSDDYLKANELNYIFPDFIPSTTAGRSSDHYSSINGGSNKVNMADKNNWDYVNTDGVYRNCELQGGIWQVSEGISSDAVSFYGKSNCLFYRAGAGQWKKPSEDKVFSEGAGDVYPGYGYMISRTLWGDNLTVCEYKESSDINTRSNKNEIRAFLTNRIKMQIGHDGGHTGVSAGTNVESKVSTTKHASYTFKGVATETFEYYTQVDTDDKGTEDTDDDEPIYDWVEDSANIEQKVPVTEIDYSLTHALYKYTPFNTDIVNNSYGGETIYKSNNGYNATTRVAFSSQLGGLLSVFPEVKYKLYYTNKYEEYETPDLLTVYCMGEEARRCKPASIHGYKVMYNLGTNLQGKSIVDNALTGTAAFDFANNFNDNTQEFLQVSASGGGFETASTNKVVIYCTSFTLDLYNNSINGFNPKENWGSGIPVESHDFFVNALNENIEAKVTMKRFMDATNSSQFGSADDMSFDYNQNVTSTSTEQLRLRFANGRVNTSDKAAVISKIATAYGVTEADATLIWNNSGIENQLDRMFESSTDNNNNSGVSGITDSKWYDEESDCLAITINQSSIIVGDIIFSDKNDYGSSTSQSATDISSIGRNGVEARFYLTLKFINPYIEVDGFTFDLSDKMILVNEDEMKGARFLISNVTTNNWIK